MRDCDCNNINIEVPKSYNCNCCDSIDTSIFISRNELTEILDFYNKKTDPVEFPTLQEYLTKLEADNTYLKKEDYIQVELPDNYATIQYVDSSCETTINYIVENYINSINSNIDNINSIVDDHGNFLLNLREYYKLIKLAVDRVEDQTLNTNYPNYIPTWSNLESYLLKIKNLPDFNEFLKEGDIVIPEDLVHSSELTDIYTRIENLENNTYSTINVLEEYRYPDLLLGESSSNTTISASVLLDNIPDWIEAENKILEDKTYKLRLMSSKTGNPINSDELFDATLDFTDLAYDSEMTKELKLIYNNNELFIRRIQKDNGTWDFNKVTIKSNIDLSDYQRKDNAVSHIVNDTALGTNSPNENLNNVDILRLLNNNEEIIASTALSYLKKVFPTQFNIFIYIAYSPIGNSYTRTTGVSPFFRIFLADRNELRDITNIPESDFINLFNNNVYTTGENLGRGLNRYYNISMNYFVTLIDSRALTSVRGDDNGYLTANNSIREGIIFSGSAPYVGSYNCLSVDPSIKMEPPRDSGSVTYHVSSVIRLQVSVLSGYAESTISNSGDLKISELTICRLKESEYGSDPSSAKYIFKLKKLY